MFILPCLKFVDFCSIIESVGEGVTDVAPGDHVLPVFTGECKECPHCKSAESNMCDLLRINTDRGVMIGDGKSRFSINGKPIYHFVGTSTFSEYTVMHVGCVAKINPEAPLDKVCVLSCGISTGKFIQYIFIRMLRYVFLVMLTCVISLFRSWCIN
jgi:alcohol dehydrogenase class-P